MTEVTMNELVAMTQMRHLDFGRQWQRASADDWARVVESFPLFRGISRRGLSKLVRQATFAEIAPGASVAAPARDGSLYVVLGGTATARRGSAARPYRVGDSFAGGAAVVAKDDLHVMRLPLTTYARVAHAGSPISFARLSSLLARFRPLETEAAQG
jgi:hypothetical protein